MNKTFISCDRSDLNNTLWKGNVCWIDKHHISENYGKCAQAHIIYTILGRGEVLRIIIRSQLNVS